MGLFKHPEKDGMTVSVSPAETDIIQVEGQTGERVHKLQRGLKPRHISVCPPLGFGLELGVM